MMRLARASSPRLFPFIRLLISKFRNSVNSVKNSSSAVGGLGAGFAGGGGRVADGRGLVGRGGDEGPAFHGRGTAEALFAGQVAGQAFQRKILAQGVVGIAFPHEDA